MGTTGSIADEPYSPAGFIEKQRILSRAEYRRVVMALAQDQEPGIDDMNALLFAVSKSYDDLEADVATVRNRLDWAKQRTEARQWAEQAKQKREELATVENEANELSRKFREKIEPLLERQQALRQQAESLESDSKGTLDISRRKLEQSSDPAIEMKRQSLQQRLSEALGRINLLNSEYGRERWSDAEEQRLQAFERRVEALRAQKQLEQDDSDKLHHWKLRRAAQQELPQLEKKADELQQEINSINTEKLAWQNVTFWPVGTSC